MNAKDQLKLIKAGFTILRGENLTRVPSKKILYKIKAKDKDHHNWYTFLSDYKTSEERDDVVFELSYNERVLVDDSNFFSFIADPHSKLLKQGFSVIRSEVTHIVGHTFERRILIKEPNSNNKFKVFLDKDRLPTHESLIAAMKEIAKCPTFIID